MKKIIAAAAVLLTLVLLMTGCGDRGINGTQNSSESEERPEYVLDGITLSKQIDCFMENEDEWMIESDFEIPQYTITDLDKNGRIELISAITQGTGLFTTFHIYEINEAGDGFCEVKYNFDTEGSLPDIAASDCTAYYNNGTNEWIYIVNDTLRNGAAEYWLVTNTLELYDGELSIEQLGTFHSIFDNSGNEKKEYFDYSGEEISEEGFNSIADTAYGMICDRYDISFKWFAVTDGQHTMSDDVIEEALYGSYESFIFSGMSE